MVCSAPPDNNRVPIRQLHWKHTTLQVTKVMPVTEHVTLVISLFVTARPDVKKALHFCCVRYLRSARKRDVTAFCPLRMWRKSLCLVCRQTVVVTMRSGGCVYECTKPGASVTPAEKCTQTAHSPRISFPPQITLSGTRFMCNSRHPQSAHFSLAKWRIFYARLPLNMSTTKNPALICLKQRVHNLEKLR